MIPRYLIKEEVIHAVGLNAATIFSKIEYWTDKCGKEIDNRRWIYNSYATWQQQFSFFSKSTLQRAFKTLIETKLIFAKKMNAKKGNHVLWYAVNEETR